MTMEQAQALFAAHGCSLTEQQYAQLCRYETELVQYNETGWRSWRSWPLPRTTPS